MEPPDDTKKRQETWQRSVLPKATNRKPPQSLFQAEIQALCSYALGEVRYGDQLLAIIRKEFFDKSINCASGNEGGAFHWHANTIARIYFLYGTSSRFFPGRMSKEAENYLLEMLWTWASQCKQVYASDPTGSFWGTENHMAQAWTGFWGAAEIFVGHPAYSSRKYADGSTAAEMLKAFNSYWLSWSHFRAMSGLLTEQNSDYNKYTIAGWYNMADFASDLAVRCNMSNLLQLYWMDYVLETTSDGARGGARSRCYPGRNSVELSSCEGLFWLHFGYGPISKHPALGCAATTLWRPSAVLSSVAKRERGPYEYISKRLGGQAGQVTSRGKKDDEDDDDAQEIFSARKSLSLTPPLLRYTFVSPGFVMGVVMMESKPWSAWDLGACQNRWHGIIFSGHPNARIFTQPDCPLKGSVYNAEWGVQHRGSLILQRLREAKGTKGQRVWFSNALHRAEQDGWVIVEAPKAFAAVRVAFGSARYEPDSNSGHEERNRDLTLGVWLRLENEFSPILFDAVSKEECSNMPTFISKLKQSTITITNSSISYRSAFNGTTLELYYDYSRIPLIDGHPVNLSPLATYQAPFLQSAASSIVITDGEVKEQLNFSQVLNP